MANAFHSFSAAQANRSFISSEETIIKFQGCINPTEGA
jgi:hypothetical protein